MRIKLIICYLLPALCWQTAVAQTVRMANGSIIQGEVVKSSDAGLDIQTPAGTKTYTWDTLSWSTRFRYQPKFRANFDAVVSGKPPSARTRTPDPEETSALLPQAPEETAAAPAAETAEAPATAPATLLIWDHFSYNPADSFRTGGFPSSPMRTPASTIYHGLQYGPTRRDVVYFAIDPKEAADPRDLLVIYSPYDPAYTSPTLINGFKKGGGVVAFKKFPLKSKFGEIDALFDVEYMGMANDEEMLTVTAQLMRGDQKCRFLLGGRLGIPATEGQVIAMDGLIDWPIILTSLDVKSSPMKVNGELLMAHLRVVPKDNMDTKLIVEIVKDDGSVLQKEAVRMDETGLLMPTQFSVDLKKTEPGKTYKVRTSIHLGPFLGPVTGEDEITIPAK